MRVSMRESSTRNTGVVGFLVFLETYVKSRHCGIPFIVFVYNYVSEEAWSGTESKFRILSYICAVPIRFVGLRTKRKKELSTFKITIFYSVIIVVLRLFGLGVRSGKMDRGGEKCVTEVRLQRKAKLNPECHKVRALVRARSCTLARVRAPCMHACVRVCIRACIRVCLREWGIEAGDDDVESAN